MPQEYVLKSRAGKQMEPKKSRTIIDISQYQPQLDFDEAELYPPFAFPDYQRSLLGARFLADLTDLGIVAAIYTLFVAVTYFQMAANATFDRRLFGVYSAGYILLVGVYFFLFMLSSSQTPGMKLRKLVVVNRDGTTLRPETACLRGLGCFVSIIPLMLGFVWALIDPEHLTWADKVSGTYLKKT
jgi:uncharacterized RDD family membrane protein YckC